MPPKPRLTIPRNWTASVQAATLQVIAFAQYSLAYARSWATNSPNERIRLTARTDQLHQEIALLREEIRIKDLRMATIPAARRPHYRPTERLAILELRAARGWSLEQTARVFQVTAATIASWGKRLDDHGPRALLQSPGPVNRFPDYVRAIVQRLQALCPRLGKVKIAQILARAGLHLAVSSVGRIRRELPIRPTPLRPLPTTPSLRRVTADRPNHVWHVDLTVVPTGAGFWVPWLPLALPQCWPFGWWVAMVIDHYSRRALGSTIFKQQPTSLQVRRFLSQLIAKLGTSPKYLVTDSGPQFTSVNFGPWCRRHGIRHRRGAVGQTGSIAVCERFVLTLKQGCTRVLSVVPLMPGLFQRELDWFVTWYNQDRPHMTLQGTTPDEIYFHRRPANRTPRFEPRVEWPRRSACAAPQTLVKGQPGVPIRINIRFVGGRRHLPQVTLSRAA
jgi:putative transposase